MAKTRIFISYSHQDRRYLERLRIFLRPLQRQGMIDAWDDSRIKPGTPWRTEIRKALDEASVAILLVSADFLASDFVATDELPPLLAKAESDGTVILPLIVGHCRFTQTKELARFQAVNEPSKPLSSLTRPARDQIYLKLTQRVESLHQEQPGDVNSIDAAKDEAAPSQPEVPPSQFGGLASRLAEATAQQMNDRERNDQWRRQANEALARLARIASVDVGGRVRQNGFERFFVNRETVIKRFFPKVVAFGDPDILLCEPRGFVLAAPTKHGIEVVLHGEIMVTLTDDGQLALDAHYMVAQRVPPGDRLIAPEQVNDGISLRARVGSPEEVQAESDIGTYLSENLEAALSDFVRRAGGEGSDVVAVLPLHLSFENRAIEGKPGGPQHQVVSLFLRNDSPRTVSNFRFDVELPFMPLALTDPLTTTRSIPPIQPRIGNEPAGKGFVRWRTHSRGNRLFLEFRSDGQASIWANDSAVVCEFWLVASWYGLHSGSDVVPRPVRYECEAEIQVEGMPPQQVRVPFDFHELIPGRY